MDFEVKIIFTIFCIFICVGLFITDRGDDRSHAGWMGGVSDPIRMLIMNKNGTFRKFYKAFVVVFFLVFLTIVWIL